MVVVDLIVEFLEQQPPEIPAYSKVMVISGGLAAFHKSYDYPTHQSLENFVVRASSMRVCVCVCFWNSIVLGLNTCFCGRIFIYSV